MTRRWAPQTRDTLRCNTNNSEYNERFDLIAESRLVDTFITNRTKYNLQSIYLVGKFKEETRKIQARVICTFFADVFQNLRLRFERYRIIMELVLKQDVKSRLALRRG